MSSNWDNFRKNLGEWHGSFTRVTPTGELGPSVPSILVLEDVEEGRRVRFQLRQFAQGLDSPPTSQLEQEYSSIGHLNVFFPNGTFSKGSLQVAPFAEFGAEYGFVQGNRRLRFVQLYDKDQHLQSMILIREFRAGTGAQERPPLTVEQLLGEWQGTAYTVYADGRPATEVATHLHIQQEGNRLFYYNAWAGQKLQGTAVIEGRCIHFQDTDLPQQLLLLPDGTSSLAPLQISFRRPFRVEVGWLWAPGQRQRVIRSYGERGEWISATLVLESSLHH
ncbi:MAG: DUF3598 family protein [Cyanobacteriota bacterium]